LSRSHPTNSRVERTLDTVSVNLADQKILLGAKKIGIEMSDDFQLWPEQSTSALACHHPSAKYFTI